MSFNTPVSGKSSLIIENRLRENIALIESFNTPRQLVE